MKFLCVLTLFTVSYVLFAKGDIVDPIAILQRSADATAQLNSFKADVISETVSSTSQQKGLIFQKKQVDGSLLLRLEMEPATNDIRQQTKNAIPMSNNYTLITPKGAYSVRGKRAIKINGFDTDKLKVLMDSDYIKSTVERAKSEHVECTLSNGFVNGRDCWVVSVPSLPSALNSAKNSLNEGLPKELLADAKVRPTAIPLSVSTVMYIDKQTLLISKQECLDADGNMINSLSIQNLREDEGLGDDLFTIPDDVKVEDLSEILKKVLKQKNTVK